MYNNISKYMITDKHVAKRLRNFSPPEKLVSQTGEYGSRPTSFRFNLAFF